ncbi:hypothetical protein [Microbispora sp. H11081]|uniref:hypothetical protein n=1 Tax=Microbispora sp. H11081 TaxID=2729107 RepID=UPI00147430CA|nr:hypothetical protein [Microbispora sp. H11081]
MDRLKDVLAAVGPKLRYLREQRGAEELKGSGVTVNSVHPATYMPTAMSRRSGMEVVDTLGKGWPSPGVW